jgi:NAD(P)-dependent dehydrogenase (short-subunit alcohol dehydrogenase family)
LSDSRPPSAQKTLLVTGAASGIGRATARLFAERGWFVGLFDLDEGGARAALREVGEARGVAGKLDVRDEAAFARAVAVFGEATGGAMHALFNSAGVLRMGPFDAVPIADARLQLDVNVLGIVIGVRAALPLLEKTRDSVVVNMSSASAAYGVPELAVYSASKFAVRALTEALDIELAPRGVRVCDVMPGYVDTPMVSAQRTPAKSVAELGVRLTAGDVAHVVWDAVHGRKVHWIPQTGVRAMLGLGGLLPGLGRAVMRRVSRH